MIAAEAPDNWVKSRPDLAVAAIDGSPRFVKREYRATVKFEPPLLMLESIAKALTRRLLQDNPGIGIREVSERASAFGNAVRSRVG
jgi:hypothetical protein